MMMDCITVAGFILAIFAAGVAVGKFIGKIERFIRENEDEKNRRKYKNDRR